MGKCVKVQQDPLSWSRWEQWLCKERMNDQGCPKGVFCRAGARLYTVLKQESLGSGTRRRLFPIGTAGEAVLALALGVFQPPWV